MAESKKVKGIIKVTWPTKKIKKSIKDVPATPEASKKENKMIKPKRRSKIPQINLLRSFGKERSFWFESEFLFSPLSFFLFFFFLATT